MPDPIFYTPWRATGDFSRFNGPITAWVPEAGRQAVVQTSSTGGGADDVLQSTVRTLTGTPLGDTFVVWPGAGEWRIDGRDGRDTLSPLLVGFRDARITGTPGSDLGATMSPPETTGAASTVLAPRGGVAFEGTTLRLANVEHAEFVDGTVSFDTAGRPAQVFRLYRSALDRAPDQAGLAGWVEMLERGAPPKSLAAGFLGSAEFNAFFPAAAGPDHGAYVDQLYLNVLDRPADPVGRANWVHALSAGARDRADVLLEFSESPEHVAKTRAEVQAGVWLLDERAAGLARLYDAALGRQPDVPGLAAWKADMRDNRKPLPDVAEAFADSPEFRARHGGLGDEAFVAALYLDALDRQPDQAGLAAWVDALGRGAARSEVVLAFSESPEHVAATTPRIDDGVVFA